MSCEIEPWSNDQTPATKPAVYRYLFIMRNRDAYLIEEPGGHILHLMRKFLEFLKERFPEVIYTRFKGRVVPEDLAQLHLVVIVPVRPVRSLLDWMLEGLTTILLAQVGAEVRVSIPRHAFQIELGSRRGTEGIITSGDNHFETATKMLVALLLLDEIQTEWVRGTSSRRIVAKRRMAFFVDRPCAAEGAPRRGRFLARRTPLAE